MKKSIIVMVFIIVILIGIFIDVAIKDKNNKINEINNAYLIKNNKNNEIIQTTEISSKEEKTTPNTLIIYKTYYTKCKHFLKRYEEIDVSKVNLTKDEFGEKYRNWKLDKFSEKEIELSKEEEKFCGQHYRIKLENDVIIIYRVDENGEEVEYEKTDINKKYLTSEDIWKLTNGIIVFGKENLTATIEDYE